MVIWAVGYFLSSLKYGHLDFTVLDDESKEYFDYNVAVYIFSQLDTDGF